MLGVESDMEAEMMPASGVCIKTFELGAPHFHPVDSCGW